MSKYADHISALCQQHSISVGSHSRGGRAYRKQRRINIRPVKTAITYCIALHEIGHIMGKMQSGNRLDKETGAWHWAMDNALEWTDVMDTKMGECLTSYVEWAKRHKTAKEPGKDHPVWQLLT